MEIEEAKQIIIKEAKRKIEEFEAMDYLVKPHYASGYIELKKLIEILKWSGI